MLLRSCPTPLRRCLLTPPKFCKVFPVACIPDGLTRISAQIKQRVVVRERAHRQESIDAALGAEQGCENTILEEPENNPSARRSLNTGCSVSRCNVSYSLRKRRSAGMLLKTGSGPTKHPLELAGNVLLSSCFRTVLNKPEKNRRCPVPERPRTN